MEWRSSSPSGYCQQKAGTKSNSDVECNHKSCNRRDMKIVE